MHALDINTVTTGVRVAVRWVAISRNAPIPLPTPDQYNEALGYGQCRDVAGDGGIRRRYGILSQNLFVFVSMFFHSEELV